jgi:hypothetical protein
MSTLSSASDLDTVIAAYADNASYQEDSSPAKARGFITACRILLVMLPKRSMHGRGGQVEFDLPTLKGEMQAAQRWLAASPTVTPDVLHPSFGNFRDFPPGSGFPGPFC